MKTYFKLELKKALFSWKAKISVLIIVATFIIPYLKELPFNGVRLDGLNCYIRLNDFSFIGLIGPSVAGFLYSTSIINDKKTGFLKRLLEIIDIKTYFKVKLIVNALATSIVFAISNCIVILYLALFYGVDSTVSDVEMIGVFSGVYERSKIIYIILMLVITIISSAVFSTFMIGVTTAVNKRFIAYLFPISYSVLTIIFFSIWGFNNVINFSVMQLFNIITYVNYNMVNVIMYNIILALIGVVLLYKFGYKKSVSLYENENAGCE
jgi:hypothetical protein